jgi:alpha-glucosidase
MQWEPAPGGGFSAGTPWLPPADPLARNVSDQEGDRGSVLWLYRDLIARRRELGPDLRFVRADETVLAYERGDHLVALNFGDAPAPAPAHGDLVLATGPGLPADPSVLAPHSGWIARTA